MTRRQSRTGKLATLVLSLVGFAAGCQDARSDPFGGETHFLSVCDASAGANSCGKGLVCSCNVCTAACTDALSCPAYPGVECRNDPGSCASPSSGVCELPCAADGDCLTLSSGHVCDRGTCRARPSGSVGGDPQGVLDCEPSSVGAENVLVIGDNLFAGTHAVVAPLEALARDAGVLSQGEAFQDQSRATEDALAYLGEGIAAQYTAGNPDGDARLVIMTGGGVDAVFGTCAEVNAQCPVLAAAALAAQELLQRMATDGVEQVVYVFYPNAGDVDQKAKVDVLRSLIQPVCEDAPVPCHLLDLRPVFEGRYDDYVVPDEGLTPEGSEATANAMWGMVGACLAP